MPTLTWAGKDEALNVAKSVSYRLLEQDSSLSYGDFNAGNMIIQGDNLAAIKSLLPYYRGMVRCIYIDPPYNTGAAFEHYDDNVSHATWLSLMYPRLEILRELLADNGSIWISIDDTECHYLKVICDEIFGRENFIADVIWEKKYSPQNDTKWLSDSHDFILVYAKIKDTWRPNLLPRTEEMNARYKNPDNDPRGLWTSGDLSVKTYNATCDYPIKLPSGRIVSPPAGYCWRFSQQTLQEMIDDNRIWFGDNGNNVPRIKRFLTDVKQGSVSKTIWKRDEVGDNQEAKKEVKNFNADSVFTTPKPERLIQRILTLATNPSDIVLDSFLGSGTTAAVAQKMNRRYIGIEIGEHAVTHVVPRLKKVIDGEEGGISKAENWQGGGGFSFFRLGEEIFTADGRIQKGVDFKTLAAHIWMEATRTPYKSKDTANSPLLGVYKDTAYYLLYNGILGDKRPQGGNVLTKKILSILPPFNGLRIIYGESSRIRPENLKAMNIIFRQTPKEIPAN